MQVTFKDVGQGDSILITWDGDSEMEIGIIDCKKKSKLINPIIDELSKFTKFSIKFIVLSHPHKDHFSGLLELLEFCEKKNIKIFRFYHTLIPDARYLEYANFDDDDNRELVQIIRKSNDLQAKGIIQQASPIALDTRMEISKNCYLKCLSPSDFEYRRYCEKVDYFTGKNMDYQCGQAANLLSTIIKIQHTEDFILFTSDGDKRSLARIAYSCIEELQNELKLCQVPHHGSEKNFFPYLWEKMPRKSKCPAVISVGENIHSHPSYSVVKELDTLGYNVEGTNIVFGLKEFKDEINPLIRTAINTLDEVSELIDESETADCRYIPFG